MDKVAQRCEQAAPLLQQIWQVLDSCLKANGIEQPLAVAGSPGSHAELREDPFDHSQSLYIEWRTAAGQYQGNVTIHGGDQVFAEFDVLQPHPKKPRWFVEAATAWGLPGALKSELRLLSALEE